MDAVKLALALSLALLSPAAAQDRAPDQGVLEVVTYNVHGLPAPITGDDTLARQRAISPLLEAFDVVGLQEDFMDPGHALLLGAVSHETRVRFEALVPGRFYGSGLALLARSRAVLRRGVHFGTFHGVLDAGSDGLASKGFQIVRLQLGSGVVLDVYNSHMDAASSAKDQAARAAQVAQVVQAMQTVSRGHAVLFLGDTNLKERRGRDARTLADWQRATGLVCACLASRETCCRRIDRIFYRSGGGLELSVERWRVASFQDAQGAPLSDHAPVQATLRWRRSPL